MTDADRIAEKQRQVEEYDRRNEELKHRYSLICVVCGKKMTKHTKEDYKRCRKVMV